MAGTDFPDPRTVPSMLEAGVSGLPRDRAWDVVATLELPELKESALTRVSFYVLAPNEVEVIGTDGEPSVADAVLGKFVETASSGVAPPLEARAVRTTDQLWSVAARRATRKPADIELPPAVNSVSVARAPDGDMTVHVDGELVVELSPDVASAVSEIVALAEREADAFVATLERFSSGRVAMSLDKL